MLSRPYSYLFSISYYGARFKGWAVQPGQRTVQGKLEKVLRFVLGNEDFTILGSSRTDAGVSCRSGFVQIFIREKVDLERILSDLNLHLGGEIRLNSVREIPRDFNLIQAVKKKTYRYFFSNSDQFHPFASAFLVNVHGKLDWEKMRESAQLFVGAHDFKAFCTTSEKKTDYFREIFSSRIYRSDEFQGQYFPEETFYFEVTGNGFLHHQVRIMMNAILKVGKGEIAIKEISQRLTNPECTEKIAPASANGLVLWETELDV
ncbi:tRNA pseudouridine(38-40) synthase TruA [Algoriphagus sp. A40]|uniref:tRNA pseudouridine(38-40) synthase TruA n=1 Tax=Algoriphagus sp. A40 TaxID=1945863 RepID=UPI0009CE1D54|nr:tRNA pseudouridine(38-40) synthase TruA [Algoriphagus sp. A40]OOG78587.1 tRNA pseudouridine(38-40) synthase TruA [Algoriphagus sp. A40]